MLMRKKSISAEAPARLVTNERVTGLGEVQMGDASDPMDALELLLASIKKLSNTTQSFEDRLDDVRVPKPRRVPRAKTFAGELPR